MNKYSLKVRLILENQSYYDKIIALLVSNDTGSIVQGVELAEAMGYFEEVHHKEYDAEGYSPAQQEWLIKPIPAFLDRFNQLHPNGVEHDDLDAEYIGIHLSGYVDGGDESISIGRYKYETAKRNHKKADTGKHLEW